MTQVLRLNILLLIALAISGALFQSHAEVHPAESLRKELNEYIRDKDATIGVAVIVDRKDTVTINGNRSFPMLSVYKFPIAVALGEHFRCTGKTIPDTVSVTPADLRPDTYSPMREKYEGEEGVRLPLYEVLTYALQQSDNNASDILLKIMGGTKNATEALNRLGIEGINVLSTEAEMHDNPELCYRNSTTPLAMAKMLDRFDHDFDDPYCIGIKRLMETCMTGRDRLAKPLSATNIILGHKTGTGFILPNGTLMAVNDVGYVHLSDGRGYSIAVFIEDSAYDMAQTEALIATISSVVFQHLTENRE